MASEIVSRREQRVSRWVTLMSRTLVADHLPEPQEYHSIRVADYVSVLAVGSDGQIPLVRQFRPALERFNLELPGGMLDPGDEPVYTAVRELYDEVGLRPEGEPELLGVLDPDSGRHENRLHCFFVSGARPDAAWQPEPGVERVFVDRKGLMEMVRRGEFIHALHIAIIGLAMLNNKI